MTLITGGSDRINYITSVLWNMVQSLTRRDIHYDIVKLGCGSLSNVDYCA